MQLWTILLTFSSQEKKKKRRKNRNYAFANLYNLQQIGAIDLNFAEILTMLYLFFLYLLLHRSRFMIFRGHNCQVYNIKTTFHSNKIHDTFEYLYMNI